MKHLTTIDADSSLAKTLIGSEVLSQNELSDYIDYVSKQLKEEEFNNKIDVDTITRSIIGLLLGTIMNGGLSFVQLKLFGGFIYPSLIIFFILAMLSMKVVTKKNAGNYVVLLSAILATVIGPVIVIIFLAEFIS